MLLQQLKLVFYTVVSVLRLIMYRLGIVYVLTFLLLSLFFPYHTYLFAVVLYCIWQINLTTPSDLAGLGHELLITYDKGNSNGSY